MKDPGEEFDELLTASVERAKEVPDWSDLPLEIQKLLSSQFRRNMELYGQENQLGDRTKTGLYGLPKSSTGAG